MGRRDLVAEPRGTQEVIHCQRTLRHGKRQRQTSLTEPGLLQKKKGKHLEGYFLSISNNGESDARKGLPQAFTVIQSAGQGDKGCLVNQGH